MYFVKSLGFRTLIAVLFIFLMPALSNASTHTDVTASRITARVQGGVDGAERYNNIRVLYYDLRVDGNPFGHPEIRLKVSRRPGTNPDMALILNSKETFLSYDGRRNYGGGGSKSEGWKAWLRNDPTRKSSFTSLVKRLPEKEQKALRGMCGYLADPVRLRDLFEKARTEQVQRPLWPTNPRSKENKKLISEMTYLAEYCLKALANAAPKSVSVRLIKASPVVLNTTVAKCNNSRLILKRGQTALSDLGFYKSTIDGIWGPATERAIVMGERLLGARKLYGKDTGINQNKCLDNNELAWLETLSEAPKSGFKCGFSRLTIGDKNEIGPKLQYLGFISKFIDVSGYTFSETIERNVVSGIIKFESSEYTRDPSKGFVRDCYLSLAERSELTKIIYNKLNSIEVLPACAGSLSSNWTNCQGTTQTWPDGGKYVGEWKDGKRNGQGDFTYAKGDKYVGEYKDDKRDGQGTYTHANGNKYVGEFKDGDYHGQGTYTYAKGDKYVGEWKDSKRNGYFTATYTSGDKYVGEIKGDKRTGQGTFAFASGAKYVGEWKNDKYDGQGTFTHANGDKYVGEWKNGKYDGQGTFTFANGTIKEGIWKDNKFQNSRTEIEAIRLAKEEELQRAIKEKEKMAEIEETKKRAELYKKEAPALIEDVREYVNSGEQFDIDLARYIQPVNGISSGEWSDDLVANYENLVAYVNKFEKFKKFRQDKALKREQIRGKLRADLKSDIQRVLVEIENWITGNPLAKESADLLNALDQFAQKPKTNEIKNLEENLAALLQKIEQSGVELPITELLNRRGYSLDGKNDPLAVANVITTLIDAQQYIKDVKAFIEENPTVFGYKVIVFYNNVRPIIENNSWTDEDKSNFSSFEEFSSKENLFVIYRKDAINTRAKGQQIALQRLRSSLVQLLADGSVYLQNNTFADNSLKVYELLEYGRSFERNTNPQDLLRAIEKLKLDFEEYQVPFVDTLISIEFLEMSDEEIILLDKMNEKTKLRNEKFDVLTVKIQEEQDLEKDALLKADVAKAEAARIKAEEEEKKASAELAKTKRKTQDETTTYVNLSDQYREEARTLITDAREYVRQGNQFSLEFVFLNADVEGFAQNEWDQIIFRKYEVFRKYVLGFESFKEFRDIQITSRKEELEAKRRLFEGEVKLSLESLRKWVLSNVLHPNAAIVLTTFNEISDYQKNLKDQLMEMDVLEEELSKLSKSLMDLKINGIYIPGVENIAVAEVDVTGVDKPKLFNLSDAKDLISDIEMYFNQGIGEFDNRFILLYGKSRGVGEDLWNASIEDAVLELKAYVLSFEQFSIFYQKQLEARREAITGQLTSLADDTVYSFELLFDWVRKNPFDVRAPELMLKLQAAQGIIDKLKINPLGSNFEDLNPLNMDLSESLAEFGIALPSKVEPKGGPLDSGLKPLTGSGEPREGRSPTSKFIYVNLSGSARNAFRNIDGGIKFENDTGGYCYEMVEPLSKIERFYTNIALQKSNIPNIGVPERCSDANISSIDLLITDGLALNEGNNLVQSAIASGFEELYQISRNDLDAAILKDDLISDNLKSDILDEVRAGYGYIVFDNNSNVGCLTVAENLDAHNYFIQETSERVLLSRKSLINTYENMSLENAFKQVQRERCGMIYSSAQHLQKLIKGLDNAKTSYNLAPEWYSSKDIRNKQEELDNDEKTNSQDKLLKQREYEEQKELEALANEQARAEAQAIQVGLRIQYGPRLKGLQSEFDTSIMNLVDGLFMGKSVTGLFSGEFGFLDRNVRSDIKKSWEEDSRELQLVDYGTGQWSGRRVEVLVSKLDIRMKNKILGKYKDLCFELMYVWDEEFGVIRDPMATKCADGMLEQWLNKQGFESLWVRN